MLARVCLTLTLLLAAELVNEMEVDEGSAAALKTPGEPAFSSDFCPLQVLARCLTFVLSQVPWTRLPRRLQMQHEPARCAADGCAGAWCLVLSCVFRVPMLVASLLCVLC